jgi:hypothetical protein
VGTLTEPQPADHIPVRFDREAILARLPEDVRDTSTHAFSWSPDGAWVVFQSRGGVYLFAWTAGDGLHHLTDGTAPTWQPTVVTPTFTPALPSPSPSITPSPAPTYDLAEDVPENVDVWGTHRLPHFNVTLPVPPDWVIEERDERMNTLYGATYQPPLWDAPEDCGYQCPSISAVIYRDTVTITHGTTVDALRTWLEEHSTSEPFGADVDDMVIFFGVERIEETLWDGQQALSFYSEAMGIRSYEVLTIVNGHVVGLSKSHVDRFEFEPVYEIMRTHAMIKPHPLHPTATPSPSFVFARPPHQKRNGSAGISKLQ